MASEVIEKKIIQLGLDKQELTTGLQKAMSEVDGFTSKLKGIKTTSFDNIKSSVSNMSSSFSGLLDKIPIVSSLKEHITNLGRSSGEAAIGLSQINQNGNFQAIISGSNDAARGVEGIGEATSNIGNKFSVLEGAASVALGNIAAKAISTATSIINKWTFAPILQGYQEYERELDSTRILVSALGESESDHITSVMRDLEQYAKTTRYSSQEMNAATAQFVNAGIGLDESATALKGWGNLAASASASTADFNRTLQTSVEQALQMGYMNLQNWRQIQNANMATKKFKDTIIQTALAQGDVTGEIQGAIDAYGELNDQAVNYLFNERLTEGKWFTNDVMMSALTEYANDPELMKQAASLYTFKEALEATEESVSDAWSKFWIEVVGKGDEAVAIWTPVGQIMQDIVSFVPNAMTQVAKVFNQLDGRSAVIKTFQAAWEKLTLVGNSFKETFKNVFPSSQNTIAKGIIHIFETLSEKISGSEINVNSLNQIFTAFWRVLKIGIGIVGAVAKVLDFLIPDNLIQMAIDLVSVFARVFNIIYDNFAILKSYVNTSPLSAMFDSVRDTVGAFWDFFATILGAIIDKTTNVVSAVSNFGAHMAGSFLDATKHMLGFGKSADDAGKPVETLSQKFIKFQQGLTNSLRTFHDTYLQTQSLSDAFSAFGKKLELVIPALKWVFDIIKSAGSVAVDVVKTLASHWEALLAPIALVAIAVQSIGKVFSAVWDEANRVYDITGRIKNFASDLFGNMHFMGFGGTVYADELDGMSDSMNRNIPLTERLASGVDALAGKLTVATANFKMNAEAIANSSNPIKLLTSKFKSLGTGMVKFFNFDDFIAGIKGVGSESTILTTKMGQLGDFLNKHLRIDWEQLISAFKNQSLSLGSVVGTVTGWLKEFASNLDFSSKAAFIKSVFAGIGETFKNIGGTIGSAIGSIGDGLTNLGNWIVEFANSKSLSNILQAGSLLTFISLLRKFGKIAESFNKIPNSIAGLLSDVGGVLKSYQKEIKAKSIREIATALLLMSGALFVIATIPTNKLLPAVATLATMATILVGAYTTIKFAQKKFGGSSSDGIMGNVVDALGLGEVNKLMKKIGTAVSLVALGATLLMIIKPFKEIAAMDWGEILKGVLGMGAVLTEIVGATWAAGLAKVNLGTAGTIYAIGNVLKACVGLMQPLSEIDGGTYTTSLLKIAGIAAVIAGAVALMSGKFEYFNTGLVSIEWGQVKMSTAVTILALTKAIGDIIDSFAVINQYDASQIDTAVNTIQRIASSIRNAIMLMTATLTLGTGGSAGAFKVGNKELFSGLPQMGLKLSTGTTKWSLAATILSFVYGIKGLIDSFKDINELNSEEIDRAVDTINKIMRSLTLAIVAMSFTASLNLGSKFKGSIGTGGMNWAQSLGIAVFVAGLLFLMDQLDDLAKIDPKRLDSATNAVKTVADQLGMLFLAMNIGAVAQEYMGTDLSTMAATIGMMGVVIIALKVVGDQLIQFSTLNSEQLGIAQVALITVGGVVTVMTTVLAGLSILLDKMSSVAGIVESLAILAGVVIALKVVGDEFVKFSGLSATELATAKEALLGISLAIGGLVAVLAIFGLVAGGVATIDPLVLVGVGEIILLLVAVIAAIKIVGDEFIKLGGMASGQIANARVALEAITEAIEGMVGVLAIFGLITGVAGTIAPGVLVSVPEVMSGAVKAAEAIAKLGPTFVTLGAMDTGSISRAKSAMTYIQNALKEMVKTGFWESWFKNWEAVKDKMSATNTAAKAMKNAASALEELGTTDVSIYQQGNSNLAVVQKGLSDMIASASKISSTTINETALENAQLLRKIMKAIGDAFDEAGTIATTDTSTLQASVSNLASSAAAGLTSPEVQEQYNQGGQSLVQSTRSGVDIMAPYMGDGGVLAAGSFVNGVKTGQIDANSAGTLLTTMAQQGASSSDLYAVAQTLGGTYTNGIFSLNGQSYNVGSGLTSQANAGAGSGVGALSGTGNSVGSTFAGGISGSSGTVKTAGSAILDAAKAALSVTLGFKDAGSAIVDALAGGIRAAIGKIKSAASDVMQAIKDYMPHSPAPEGPFSGSGWTAVKSSGLAVAEEWISGLVEGYEDTNEIEKAISQVQSTINDVNNYAYDNLQLSPTITPVVDMSGINSANLQLRNFKMGYNGVAANVSFSDLNQATMQAAQTRYTIDNVIEGMNIMNNKLEAISGKTDVQTKAIEDGKYVFTNIDGKTASKQLAPYMSLAQQAYSNQVSRRKGQLPSIS